MDERFLAAAVQLNSSEDKVANLRQTTEFVAQAAERGARLVALPEMFNCIGHFDVVVKNAEPIPGPTTDAIQELARRWSIVILAGSIAEKSPQASKAYNTSVLYSAGGELLARYRKVHLFDINLPNRVHVTESNWIIPGDRAVTADMGFGRAGLSICYDLRFPEFYRRLADQRADVIFAPAAFTSATGRDHWETLVRARAIENQAFVIAPNQCGQHADGLQTYGNSMIVGPWGNVLARATDQEGIVCAEIDMRALQQIRTQLPALNHRRGL
ncbi:MAG: carbon-nitrogen hydrolase family protein [Pirellulales bacterium]